MFFVCVVFGVCCLCCLLSVVSVLALVGVRKKKRMKLAGEKRRRRKTKSADVGDRVPHAHKGSSVNRVVAAADTDNGERVVAALEDPLVAVHSDIRNDSGGGGDDGDGSGDDSIIEIIRESKPSSHLQPLWQQQQKIPNFDRAMAQATAHTRASLEQSVLALSRRLAAAGRPADLRSTLLFLAEEGIPAFLEASVADARRRVQGAEGLRSSAEGGCFFWFLFVCMCVFPFCFVCMFPFLLCLYVPVLLCFVCSRFCFVCARTLTKTLADLTAYYAQRLPPDSLPTSPNPANTIKLAIESAQTAGERAGLESEFDVIEARAAVADAWADLDHAVARHSSDSHSPPAQIKQLPPPLPLPLPQQQPSATTVKIPAAPAAPGIEQKQIILQKNKARLRRLERRRTRTFAKLSDSDLEIVTKKKNSLGLQITRRAVGEAYRSLWAERKRLRGLEDALRISKTLAFKQALSTLTNNQLGEVLLGTVASASVGLRHVPPSDDDIFVITPREHGDSELDLALPLEPQPSPEPSALISRKNSDSGGTNIITRMFQNLTIGSPQTKGTESTENPRLRSSTQPPALEYYNNSHPNSQRSDSVQPESAPEYWDHPEVQAAMAAMDLLLQPQTSDTTMVENDHTTPGNPNSAALVLTVSKNTTASPAMRSQPTWQSWFMAFAGFQDSSPARTRPETKYSPDLLDMVAKIKTDTIFDQEGRWEGVVSFVKRQVSGLGDESGAETLLQYPLFNSLLDAGDLSEFFTTPIRGIRQDQKSRWDQVRAFFPELGRIQAIVEQEGVEMIEGGQATVRSTVWDFVAACEVRSFCVCVCASVCFSFFVGLCFVSFVDAVEFLRTRAKHV